MMTDTNKEALEALDLIDGLKQRLELYSVTEIPVKGSFECVYAPEAIETIREALEREPNEATLQALLEAEQHKNDLLRQKLEQQPQSVDVEGLTFPCEVFLRCVAVGNDRAGNIHFYGSENDSSDIDLWLTKETTQKHLASQGYLQSGWRDIEKITPSKTGHLYLWIEYNDGSGCGYLAKGFYCAAPNTAPNKDYGIEISGFDGWDYKVKHITHWMPYTEPKTPTQDEEKG